MQLARLVREFLQDIWLSLRLIRRSPGFFAGALLILALGVGANAAVFGILQAALLQPLPYTHPEQLHMLWRRFPSSVDPSAKPRTLEQDRGVLTSPTLIEWHRELASSVGDVAALLSWQGNLAAQLDYATRDRVLRLNGAFATPNFFDLLGVRAKYGRLFNASDERDDSPLLVVSHAFWQRELGGDASIIGRAITLIGGQPRAARSYIVIGVLPADVHFTYPEETQVWAMMSWSAVQAYEPRAIAFRAVMRLDPRVPLGEARRRASSVRGGFESAQSQPPQSRPYLAIESMNDWVRREIQSSLTLLGGVAALLLVVTCVTVGGALLARVSERRRELAVRTALGAERARLARQLLAEGTTIAFGGALVGVALAGIVQPLLRALLPESVPRVGAIGATPWLVAFGFGAAIITILLATLLPTWTGSRVDLREGLSRGDGHSSVDRATKRWQQTLIAAQAAIATVLLASGTLLLTSFWRLGQVPLGFDGSRVVTVEMRLLDRRFRDGANVTRFADDLMNRVHSIPQIVQAGLASSVPFRGTDFTLNVGKPGVDSSYILQGRYVDGDYFGVLRVPILRGRLFARSDTRQSRRVVILSQSAAAKMFGAGDPIGHEIKFDSTYEVIGVAADVRYKRRDQDPAPAVYFARAQSPSTLICVVARIAPGASIGQVSQAIYHAVHETDATIPPMRLTTIDEIVDETVANRRFYTVATVAFASIAFLLTAVGICVVVARVIAQRRKELAIRAALGATVRDIARHASRDTIVATVIGAAGGLVCAFGSAPMLSQFMFGVSARSLMVYALVASMMIAISVVGIWIPLRRFAQRSVATLLTSE
jgi:putative ABC transport system permease protein